MYIHGFWQMDQAWIKLSIHLAEKLLDLRSWMNNGDTKPKMA